MTDLLAEKRHFAVLDGLRGVAAVSVMLFHAQPIFGGRRLFPHAGLAVDFFFMLSGLVIAYAYEDRFRHHLTVKSFAWRRIQRLYPLIFLGSALGLIVHLFSPYRGRASYPEVLAVYLPAAFCLPLLLTSRVQDGANVAPLNPPAWSLFFELFANAVYAFAQKWLSNRILCAVVGLSWLSLTYVAYIHGNVDGGHKQESFIDGFPRVMFPFFVGVGLYRLEQRWSDAFPRPPAWLLALALMATLCAPRDFGGKWLYELGCVTLIYPAIIAAGTHASYKKRDEGFIHVSGQISYPIYILHAPIFAAMSVVLTHLSIEPHRNGTSFGLLAGMLAFILAWAALKLYDEPMRARLRMLGRTPVSRRPGPAGVQALTR